VDKKQEDALREIAAFGQLQGDNNWIKVKPAHTVEIDGVRYVSEEHHIEETTFLIEEIRKLAKLIESNRLFDK
jgi:hypothetical protein